MATTDNSPLTPEHKRLAEKCREAHRRIKFKPLKLPADAYHYYLNGKYYHLDGREYTGDPNQTWNSSNENRD